MGDEITGLGSPLASLLLRTGVIALALAVLGGAVAAVRARRRPGVSRAEDSVEPPARRFLRIATAALWIADGLLQMQPMMPAGFISADIQPTAGHDPGWLRALVDLLSRAWQRHPVAADVAIVEAEIGIGLLLLLARRGRLGRVAACCAGAMAMGIWVVGEGFGGLVASGAGWLTGAPGAALVYAAAAGLLLLPWSWWTDGRAVRAVRLMVAGWLLAGAALQALPAEGFWTGPGLAAPFADGASMRQPSGLNAPMHTLAVLASHSPPTVNGLVVAVLVATAAWLLLDRSARPVLAGLVLCAGTWWLAQDFGVFGGTATDPNTALPLGLVLAAALPAWQASGAERPVGARPGAGPVVARRFGIVLALTLTFAVPLALILALIGPADHAALAADSGGGMRAVPPRPLPTFSLVDQAGHRVTTSGLRGKVVVITFLDPVCTSECPLIAGQLAAADRRLGVLSGHVEFVAVDSNPVFHNRADVASFTRSHGLADLRNWHFLFGGPDALQSLMSEFGMGADVPVVGMVGHSSGVFFVTADGREAAYLDDGASAQLTTTYAEAVEREVRALTL